jgi:DNA-binding NtrC family response regulator
VVAAHEGGTVFLDEIGELPMDLQPKLLRLLENREVLPVGSERPERVDVLLLAATNQHLESLVEQRRFRRDLYSRLITARVSLPPLRRRAEDLFAIAAAVAPRCGLELDPDRTEVEAVERLMLQRWPENVRGLMATLSRAAALDPAPGLRLWALAKALEPQGEPTGAGSKWPPPPAGPCEPPGPAGQRGMTLTAEVVSEALRACDGNETRAARRLGVSRGKLRRFRQKG